VIVTIISRAELRHKRVNVFIVNLAVGDLLVCFVTMTTSILFVVFGRWVVGAVACKLFVYGHVVTLASTTFLLTAMSIDRYQVSYSVVSWSFAGRRGHRRNNHGDRGRQVPQLLGWGTSNVLVPLNFLVERSFSSLRRLKTYLRNSMSQQRLNHLAVLHVHTDRLHSIDIDVIAREFVVKSENRHIDIWTHLNCIAFCP